MLVLQLLAEQEERNQETRRASYRLRVKMQRDAIPVACVQGISLEATQGDTANPMAMVMKPELGVVKVIKQGQGNYHGLYFADTKPARQPAAKVVTMTENTDIADDGDGDGEPYADRGNKDKITCPSLFLRGVKDHDEFRRDYALNIVRYMIFKGSKGKGSKDKGTTKVKSSARDYRLDVACYGEDLVQDAFVLYLEAKKNGKFLCTKEATKQAYANHCRKQALADPLAYKAYAERKGQRWTDEPLRRRVVADSVKENSVSRLLPDDKEATELLNTVVQEGIATVETLSTALGVHRNTISNRFRKLREAMA